MKRIPLFGKFGSGKFAIVDETDFEFLSQRKWWSSGLGHVYSSHPFVSLHRLVLNAPPGTLVDHVNHDPLDNRRANLRLCDSSQNNANRTARPGHYKGVYRAGGGAYRAVIRGRDLGKFPSKEAAALAWNAAAIEEYGEFASLNEVAA